MARGTNMLGAIIQSLSNESTTTERKWNWSAINYGTRSVPTVTQKADTIPNWPASG
jgi:hypothetical protein